MKNLNICIDIDGTITEPYYWLDDCNKYFNTKISEEEVTEYYIHKVLGITEKQYDEYYEKYKFKIHSTEKLREDAKPILTKLSLTNNIYFVTARDKSLTILTYRYLIKNRIPYNDLFVLGSHYKVNTAKDLDCDVFIEDNYDNAIHLSNAGFKVLLLDTNYNRMPINENIIRVFNWNEIYEMIKELLLQDKVV
ncbi:hypothetical protein NNC19_10110 [Clostridium sp. SHJSY1]|uniref:5' nucleotidase, NT5C type n=1 Tax=Clostridium sp. SHJSY1 TaxID=2942483 RepID=UPI0028740708|nr:hypothetical protein [Clostridium sp. SHJSY1]MDS0526033.1 hypothetical protein [Clostridium sp. SHJSY1]